MTKKTLIIILIVAVVIISIGLYFQNQRNSNIVSPEQGKEIKTEGVNQYRNLLLGIEFDYPKNFIPYLRDNEYLGDQPSRFVAGKDSYALLDENSYFVITLNGVRGYYDCPSLENSEMSYSGSYEDIQQFIQEGKPIKLENCKEIIQTIDQIAKNSAYHKLLPFGENSTIHKLEIETQEARLIIPSDAGINETELIVRLKNPVLFNNNYWTFLIIHVSQDIDGEVIKMISKSLHFI
ncbi:MAG TPA: hypothetical protein PL164_00030 [Candidatus Paceibacterota bacterium]|nr:hypothetical protein [Candidatus Paceibacterota bacterium]HOK17143.1 hypothetical protein [Candidatus Paceibacterota bacterium]HOK97244.1 hypothetical protein [Candidatus Paceibacterota bacterium]HPP64565.1 hypothetical protein [Candidatus Paceibacterota bacterium]